MKSTRWGIIGPGKIAHDFANDLARLDTPQQIQAVLGHTKKGNEDFAKEFNVSQLFTDQEEFIKNAEIDVAYIATPHTLHHAQALACLDQKIPVLCEKPMTINLEQCNELIAASQRNKTFLMEGMWIRFLPSIQQVLYFIERGDIGRIVSIKASLGFKAPQDPDSRLLNPALGGGSLLDLGIYPVFLALLLLGNPDRIKATGSLSEKGIDEDCSILFQYKNKQHAILGSTLLSQHEIPAEIVGEKGVIKILNPWFEKTKGIEIEIFDKGKIVYPCQWPGHGLQFEAEEVVKCISDHKTGSDILPNEFSRDMITVMDDVRKQIHVTYEMYE
jgi:predicted dehydrogenase